MTSRRLTLAADALLLCIALAGIYAFTGKAGLEMTLASGDASVTIQDARGGPARAGDRLVSVDGHPVSTIDDVEFRCDGLRIGDDVTIVIERAGGTREARLTLVPYYSSTDNAVTIIIGLFYFLLGVGVYLSSAGDRAGTVFHWLTIDIAILTLTTVGRYSFEPAALGYLLRASYAVAVPFLSLLLFRFATVFPRPRPVRTKGVEAALVFAACAVGCWQAAVSIGAIMYDLSDFYAVYQTGYKILILMFLVVSIVAIGNFLRAYRGAAEEAERRKLRWVLSGTFISTFGFLFLWWIPVRLFSFPLIPEVSASMLTVIGPVMFAIAIVRYRLFDIDLIINRGTVYGVVIFVVFALYAVSAGAVSLAANLFFGSAFGSARGGIMFIAIGAASVLVALLAEPVRRRTQAFVDRRFFHVRYNYREALAAFTESIARTYDADRLAAMVVEETKALLAPERIGFFTLRGGGTRLAVLAHDAMPEALEMHALRFHLDQLYADLSRPVALPRYIETGERVTPGDEQMFTRWNIAVIFPMLGEDGTPFGFLVLGPKKSGVRYSVEDVDLLATCTAQAGLALERITLARQLILEQEEAKRLGELSRMKSFFVSAVSHDLKTPLTSIRMFAELLGARSGGEDPRREEYLGIIEGESDRLTRLIDNVLSFSAIERNARSYRFECIGTEELIRTVCAALAYQARLRQQVMDVRPASDLPPIRADRTAAEQALGNLLANAMKYAPNGTTITVTAGTEQGRVSVSVKDEGPGIATEHLPHIFEPFYRGAATGAGVGLGLALVTHIMDAHGGEVRVESAPGAGSTFTLLFPPFPEAD